MPSDEHLRRDYADLLEDSSGRLVPGLLALVRDLDALTATARLAQPPAELVTSIEHLARERAATAHHSQAGRHFWRLGRFAGPSESVTPPPSRDRDGDNGDAGDGRRPVSPQRRSRDLLGIVAAVVMLTIIGLALAAVFRGQGQESARSHGSLPPLPANVVWNPGAKAVYAAGLGKHVDLISTKDGYTWTVHWVYADAFQTLVFYSITPPASSTYTMFANDVKITADDNPGYPRPPVYSVSGTGGAGTAIGPDGQADLFASVMNTRPVISKTDSIALTLTFSDVYGLVNAEENHKVSGGTTMHVTVPFNPGRTITVNKQGKLRGVEVNLDRLVVAPSGVMVFLSYPAYPTVSAASPTALLVVRSAQQTFDINLSDGTSWQAKAPGFFSTPDTAIWFLHSPPEMLKGNWSLVLQPYNSNKQLITDQSQWLTFTFPVGAASAAPPQPTPTPPPNAGIPIPKIFRGNSDAAALITAGYGIFPNQSIHADALTVTLVWAYADAEQVYAYYTATGLPTLSTAQTSAGELCPGRLSFRPNPEGTGLSGSGAAVEGNTLECFVEASANTSDIGSSMTLKLTTAAGGNASLTAHVPVLPARVAQPHATSVVNGQSVTLDRVMVAPSGLHLVFSAPGMRQGRWSVSFNGWNPDAGSWGSGGTQGPLRGTNETTYDCACYDLDASRPGPWTITLLHYPPAFPQTATPDMTATFTVILPPAPWNQPQIGPSPTAEPMPSAPAFSPSPTPPPR